MISSTCSSRAFLSSSSSSSSSLASSRTNANGNRPRPRRRYPAFFLPSPRSRSSSSSSSSFFGRRERRSASGKALSDEDDEYVDLNDLFDDDRPSNRKTLFDVTKSVKERSEKKKTSFSTTPVSIEVPQVMKSKAAILAEEIYGDEDEEEEEESIVGRRRGKAKNESEEEEEDLVRKVVKGVDGILDSVEKDSKQNLLVKGTWETFKRGEQIAKNPNVQKGAKIVQKVSVETVKVATPIVAKGVATGIKEGGKLAFKVALGAKNMGDERRQKKEAKQILEKKSNGNNPTWRKNEGVFKSGKVPFSFGKKEEEEEEEENKNVFGSLFGGKREQQPQSPSKKKRTDIFGREKRD